MTALAPLIGSIINLALGLRFLRAKAAGTGLLLVRSWLKTRRRRSPAPEIRGMSVQTLCRRATAS